MHRVRHFDLVLALLMVLWAGAVQAQSQAPDTPPKTPRFEVASIRMIPEKDVVPLAGSPLSPSGAGLFTMREVTLGFAIAWAFGIDSDRLSGGPDWLNMQYYEISAKPEGDAGLSYAQLRPLMQQLIQERFHLAYHRETQQRKGYALITARGGPKLTPSKSGADFGYIFEDRIRARNRSMKNLAQMLQSPIGQPVVDQTGLKGNFDFDLNYAPMDGSDSTLPSVFTALEEQLGLKLVSQTVPVEMFVIDHVERVPTEN
jgi:uncharacterized protein (TIGR03435 family)